MKANELMIGDWVQISEPCKYHGAIGRIKTLIDHKDNELRRFSFLLFMEMEKCQRIILKKLEVFINQMYQEVLKRFKERKGK